jgi:hypothetical protein
MTKIPIIFNLCNNKMYKDIKDAHNQERNKKERNRKQRPIIVMKLATAAL